MKLHEAMQLVLKENDRPMTARELADEINKRNLYTRGDREPIPPNQIGARARKYPQLFEKTEIDGRVHFLLRK
ncbi:MAG: winged helix-turn-helix domain-containing protein [Alphaproteobacteria bacterium]|nr:winged helix-turn-helix domain-containing protein [Alphaproteobacteria bacterium]